MIVVLRQSDGVAHYAFQDDHSVDLLEGEPMIVHGPDGKPIYRVLDIDATTHEIANPPSLPDGWIGGAYAYQNGEWSVANQAILDAKAEREAEAAAALEAARRAALKATRARFALAAFSAGIITDAEAEAWAGGTTLPQIVTDAFAANIADPTQRLAARIEALTTLNVHRTNPLILMLQADPKINLTDEQADALFE